MAARTARRSRSPRTRFHDLRHTHASALIGGGLDVVAISRRLGHASPAVTLSVICSRSRTKVRRRRPKLRWQRARNTRSAFWCRSGAKSTPEGWTCIGLSA
ncbi:tyrosine-type recombinase/integrase [Mesorhizobium sp. VK23B]|uniref:Tyrosine-type recombinase/integrase n=1 Tax=Mesorhizobium dulcispinae TaxID=3072316 RepID=A0ABU4X8V1_9HYPH|nr:MULTISPECIES: tyrosine-type recombinase/integrase [unclassified Mesorhizobium]MDX8464837.1 tyrosine-type recombinase/integrase [Mesorhizobium sp. VK23B]MDX8471223.1 tyrosine-type recombinase/integrase [Mesorhizobium sp. VK23A]